MAMKDAKSHLAEAFRWSSEVETELVQALVSGAGMAGPVLVGAAMGDLPMGLAASLGGLALGGLAPRSTLKIQIAELIAALAPLAAASLAAALISGHDWATGAAMMALAAVAAAIGGYSRPMAVATTRFIVFLAIVVNVADATPQPIALVVLIMAGALWTACLSLVLGAVARALRRDDPRANAVAPPAATAAQKTARWRRSLASLSGWQYTLRLAAGLGVAEALRRHWPDHHFYWIGLTVALLTQRRIEAIPVKTTQRALGTALGVVAASLFIAYSPPAWSLALGIGLLAGVRPLLRARNYLIYSAVMTPLIVLILSGGRPLESGVLIDRLIATLVAAALAILANWIAGKALADKGPPPRIASGPTAI
jgi:type IV secretory pathway VirB3-like protein